MVADVTPASAQKNDKGEQVFHVNLPEDDEETSDNWKKFGNQMLHNRLNPEVVDNTPGLSTIKEDNCKEFRTQVVLTWMFSNAALIAIFTNTKLVEVLFPNRMLSINPYLTFLFWTIAAFSFVRFLGSMIFMINWWREMATDAAMAPFRGRNRGENQ